VQRYLQICEKPGRACDDFDCPLLSYYPTVGKREVQSVIVEKQRMQRFVGDHLRRRAIDAYECAGCTHVSHERPGD
jgi:hypothetical protein